MKTLTITLLVALVTMAPGKTHAQSCNSAAHVTAKLWTEHAAIINTICLTGQVSVCTVARVGKYISQMTTYWNANIAGNGPGRIGKRTLEFNKTYTGTILGTGGRMYVSFASPASPVTVTIEETGGKGEVSAVVCKVDSNNVKTKVAELRFNETTDEKNAVGGRREVTVTGAKDDIITVHFDGKSVARHFSYTITASN